MATSCAASYQRRRCQHGRPQHPALPPSSLQLWPPCCTMQGNFFTSPSSSKPRALLLGIALHPLSHPSQRPSPTGIAPTHTPRRWPEAMVTLLAVAPTTRELGAPSPDRSKGASLPLDVPSHAARLAKIITSVTPSRPGATLMCIPTLPSKGVKALPWITLDPRCSGYRSRWPPTLGDSDHQRTSPSMMVRPT
jgi:hypothetical protein